MGRGIMVSISLFLAVFSGALVMTKWRKELKLGYALLTSFCAHVLLAYVFVYLFGSYKIAPYLIVFLPLAVLVYFLFERKTLLKHFQKDKAIVLSYLLFSVVLAVLLYNQTIWYSDEATFWARAVRELHTLEGSYFTPHSNMHHKDYYPAFIPLQYAYTKVFGYAESTLYAVNALGIMVSLVGITQTFKTQSMLKNSAFIALSMLCLSAGYPTLSINSLLIDVQLAVLLVTALIILFLSQREGGYLYPVVAISFTLIFLKSFTGLLFCGIIFLGLLFSKFVLKENIAYKAMAVCFVGIVLLQCSWSVYYTAGSNRLEYEEAVLQNEWFDSDIVPTQSSFDLQNLFFSNPRTGSIMQVLNNGAGESNVHLINDSMEILLHQKLQNANGSAFFVAACLLFFLLAFCAYSYKNRRVLAFMGFVLAACGLYFGGILFTYFIQPEILSSLLRYFSVVLVVLTLAFFKFVFDGDAPLRTWHKIALLGLFCCVLLNPIGLIQNVAVPPVNENFVLHEEITAEMAPYLAADGNTMLFYGVDADVLQASGSVSAECEYFLSEHQTVILFRNEPGYAQNIDMEFLNHYTQNAMATRLVMNFYTPEYITAVSQQLQIDEQTPMPWVFQVEKVNGKPVYTLVEFEEA